MNSTKTFFSDITLQDAAEYAVNWTSLYAVADYIPANCCNTGDMIL